jgi:glutamate synthase (NADPH) small chain
MGKDTGFLDYERRDAVYRPAEQRVKDFRAVEIPPGAGEMSEQAARCMHCGIPFCHGAGCPLANVIPEFNDAVYRGRWSDALEILLSTNPFPEFTGRVCPAPCETSCVLGINRKPVTIRQIELAIIEEGFRRGWMTPRPPAERRAERVAVVGSGPAGLAAAQRLNRLGFWVTVFENAPKPGGILRYGIPEFKLEKWVVDRRLDLMRAEGIVFETGVEIGRDLSARYLHDRFEAVVLTGGAREPRDLPVPGRELDGIHMAMTYLIQQNRFADGERIAAGARITAEGRRVVVIGGGDTGADCLGTALRQGAVSVTQIEILPEPPPARAPETPWPLWPLQRRDSSSHAEGGERMWSVRTTAFDGGADGRVCGLRLVRVAWSPAAEGGRAVPQDGAGSAFTLDAELVLLAMGFTGPGPNPLVDTLGIPRNERGFIQRDGSGMTPVEGVFAAGDMSEGASLVVRAMADGRRVAEGVARWIGART